MDRWYKQPSQGEKGKKKEREVEMRGRLRKAGENQGVAVNGKANSERGTTRRFWAPVKDMIAHSRKTCNEGNQALLK